MCRQDCTNVWGFFGGANAILTTYCCCSFWRCTLEKMCFWNIRRTSTVCVTNYIYVVVVVDYLTCYYCSLLFAMIFGVNFWLWIYGSPSAIRIGFLFGLFFLWLLVSCPLSFLGSYVGFRHRVIQSPVKINHIPRFIPSQVGGVFVALAS